MKFSKQKIVQIIEEELQRYKVAVLSEDMTDSSDPRLTPSAAPSVKSGQALRQAIRDISADSANFAGIDAKEAELVNTLLTKIMAMASEGNASTLMNRLQTALDRLGPKQ